jgi:RimJ/RimL family protein N-acetyltransferase
MLELIKFEGGHILEVETDFDFPTSARKAIGEHSVLDGYSLKKGNDILACAGVSIMWQGVAEGWLIMSRHAYKYPVSIARYTDGLFEGIMKRNNLRRIQASVNCNDEKSVKFANWLGFEYEGIMKKFGPDGADYFRYARVA